MSKKKKQVAEFKSELHTISPLPLEVLEARLYELESETIQVSTAYIDQDHIALKIIDQESQFSKRAEITGSLARWEGTQTRMDVNSRAFAYLEWVDLFGSWIRIIGIAFLLFPICASMSAFTLGQGLGAVMAIILSFIASTVVVRQLAPLDLAKGQRYTSFKAVDKLMQGIADKMTEGIDETAPILEFDGSEDSLSLLLQQEKFKHFRMGEDGEFL
jgi:hypothetical protein